jgi:hypothetical protein
LLSGSLALIVLWFDINSMVHRVVTDGKVLFLSPRTWMIIARVLYIVFALGLLFVGFIRVDETHYPTNMVFHAGGAVSAIASVVMSGLLIRKRRFPAWYRVFSLYILLGVTVGVAILGSVSLQPPSLVFLGTGIVSLTVIELVLFMMMGLWTYVTVDNLVTVENIRSLTGYATAIANRQIHE